MKLDHKAFCIYFVIFSAYLYCLYWDVRYTAPVRPAVGGLKGIASRLCFLEFWNELFQVTYFAAVVGSILLGWSQAKHEMPIWRCYLARAVIHPIGNFVAILFWAMYAFNRDFVFPESYETFMPNWLNHGVHTLPIISSLIDCYLSDFANHVTHRPVRPFLLTLTLACVHLGWLLYLGNRLGSWPYPLLQVLGVKGQMALLSGFSVVLLATFCVCDHLSLSLWAKPQEIKAKVD